MKTSIILTGAIAVLALGACAHRQPEERSYGNDGLPSAEVTAFQAMHARLNYADARIGHDAQNCATYEGRTADGRAASQPLVDAAGNRICYRR